MKWRKAAVERPKLTHVHKAFSCPSGSDSPVESQLYPDSTATLNPHNRGDGYVAGLGCFSAINYALRPSSGVSEESAALWRRNEMKKIDCG
jgi:hypothetical protein